MSDAAAPAIAPASSTAPVTAEARADRTAVTVGDPVTLTFRVVHPPGFTMVSFDPGRGLDSLTLLDQAEVPPRTLPTGQVEELRTVRVAAYEVGHKEIPAITVTWRDASGKEGSAATRPIAIEVASVLKEGQTEPADIKNPVGMLERSIWPWVGLAAALLAGLLWYLWWRRRRKAPVEEPAAPAAPPRPAHEIAYEELERLLSSGLLDRGAVKEFYIELAEIVRRYLGRRYGIDTFDRTTYEILEALRVARIPARATGMTREFLAACDLVKFAKYRPESEESRRAVESAYRLVDETKPAEATPVEAFAAGGAA
jgi:hypothetical protein